MKSRVKWFNNERGFGFIKVEGEDEKTVAEEIDANKQVETQSDAE